MRCAGWRVDPDTRAGPSRRGPPGLTGARSVPASRARGQAATTAVPHGLGRRRPAGRLERLQVGVNGLGGLPAGAHRRDDRRAAGHDVAAGEDARACCVAPVAASATMLPHLFTGRSGVVLRMSGFAPWPIAKTTVSTVEVELRALDRHRAAAPGRVRLAEFHPDAADRAARATARRRGSRSAPPAS